MTIRMTRRGVLGASLAAALPMPALAQAKPDRIVVNISGGAMTNLFRRTYFAEFEKRHGIRVVDTSPVDFGKLRAMVESGNVEWTVTELGGQDFVRAQQMNLLEPLDLSIIDLSRYPEAVRNTTHTFPSSVYSTVMAYRTDVFPNNTHPKGWAEFWDVRRFPGPRSLRNHPVDNLEFALLADGVKPDELYPLDIDRALASIDRIKDDLILWEAASQTPQLLKSKEAVYVATWDNVFEEDGFFVNFAPGIWDVAYFVMPKGAPNPELAMKLLHEMSKVENQARAAEITPVAGPSPTIMDHISPAIQAKMPTNPELRKTQAGSDRMWWAEHGDEAERRWSEYMLKNF